MAAVSVSSLLARRETLFLLGPAVLVSGLLQLSQNVFAGRSTGPEEGCSGVNTALPQTGKRKTCLGHPRLTATRSNLYSSSQVALQIPKQHVAAILKIRQLSDASAEKLIDALASSPFTSEADE